MDGKLVLATANEILKYLQRYPHSTDVAQGGHTFWLNWGCSPEQLSVTEAALDHLSNAGLVERTEMNAEILWGLSAARRNTLTLRAQAGNFPPS